MNIRRLLSSLTILLVALGGIWLMAQAKPDLNAAEVKPARASAEPKVHSKTLLSPVYHVDKKYRSMMGPSSGQEISFGEGEEKEELIWVTGYEAVMVGSDGETEQPQEFMCHSNLDINVGAHRRALAYSPGFGSRLFTLSQGQFSINFPPGYGIPLLSTETLSLTTQVLNLNHDEADFDVRHKVTVRYVKQSEVEGEPMRALLPVAAYGLKLIEGDDGYYGIAQPDEEKHGPGCLVGDNASSHEYKDGKGRIFTGHWVVEPGREVNRTLVTKLLRVPYDTRIHYIAVHLHPFAKSLQLRDLTTDETLFDSQALNFEDKVGLVKVDSFTSEEGIPIYANHEYEMVSVYENTSDEPQDSMAVMYIYLRDLELEKKLNSDPRLRAYLG